MPSLVVVEGHTDHAVVKALLPGIAVPEPQTLVGRDKAIERAADATKLLQGKRVVLLLDQNGFTPADVIAEVSVALRNRWGEEPQRHGEWWVRGDAAVRLVLSGLPDDALLKGLGISRYCVDDYVLRVLLEEEAYQSFCAGEHNLAHKPESAAKLLECVKLMKQALEAQNNKVETSKRHIHLIRAILGFEASRATMCKAVIDRAPTRIQDQVLGPLKHSIEQDPPLV